METFRRAVSQRVKTEAEAIWALEMAFAVVDSYDVDTIRNRYFLLVDQFIQKFSLRYDLRRPFTLHITPSGIYTKLYGQARRPGKLRRQSGSPPTAPARRLPPRPRRWVPAVATLIALQDEYRAWLDKLQTIAELDLQEPRAIDPPRGYGRD
jgi:hypothetical protein